MATDPLWARAQELLNCVVAGMTEAGSAPAVSHVALGNESWERSENGKAMVLIGTSYQFETFPDAVPGWVQCDRPLVGQYELVWLRCAPQATGHSLRPVSAPAVEKIESHAEQSSHDAWRVQRKVREYLADLWQERDLMGKMLPWVPLGPDGGRHGGSVTVLVELRDDDPGDEVLVFGAPVDPDP